MINFNKLKFNEEQAYKLIIIIIFAIGTMLRLLFYSYNRPFWNDECAFALNIENTLNYFNPIKYAHTSPPLFMYASKIIYEISPFKELGGRLIPLFSSLISIFIFYKLSLKFCKSKYSIIFSNLLFTFCYQLIYYSQEFKPYSTDITTFLLVLYSYFVFNETNKKYIKILIGLMYIISVWFAFPSVFALFSVFLTILIFDKNKTKHLKYIIPTIISCVIYYISIKEIRNSFMYTYWNFAFINKGIHHALMLFIKNSTYTFSNKLPLLFITITIITSVIKDFRNRETILIISPLLITLLFSYLKLYPFADRTILFLIPIFILLTAKIIDYDFAKNKIVLIFFRTFCVIIIAVPMILSTFDNIIKQNYTSENIIIPLNIALMEAKPDDIVIISDGANILYKYYGRYFDIKNNIIIENKRINNENEYLQHLNKYKKNTKYWWIFAHHPNKYRRLYSVYNWAKNKPEFKIYSDTKGNATITYVLK